MDNSNETCGACGQQFPTLVEVFSHPCDSVTALIVQAVKTTRADNVDAPDSNGDGPGSGNGQRPDRSNRYPGACVNCGQRVEAGEGLLVKDNSASRGAAWGVEHRHGHCPTDSEPEQPIEPGVRLASPKQVEFLVDLGMDRCQAERLTPTEAIQEIDRRKTKRETETVADFAGKTFPNRYAGACRRCGGHVEAETGTVGKVDGRWQVEHAAGGCETEQDLPDVPAGYYAVKSSGDNDLAFYKVDRPDKGQHAGSVFVRLVVGGQADRNVSRSQVAGILQRIIEAGPAEAMARFGQEIGSCGACGRHLTDEESRQRGLGPFCATKYGQLAA